MYRTFAVWIALVTVSHVRQVNGEEETACAPGWTGEDCDIQIEVEEVPTAPNYHYPENVPAHVKRKTKVSAKNTIVWGPGLNSPKSTTPGRYLFFQAVDTEGKNITWSVGNGFKVDIYMEHRGRRNKLAPMGPFDRGDGSYSVIYWFQSEPSKILITVKYKNKLAGKFMVTGLTSDGCHCPLPTYAAVTDAFDCMAEEPQLANDLEPFRETGITEEVILAAVPDLITRPNTAIVHYVIKDQQLYRQCWGLCGYTGMTDNFFSTVMKRWVVPDVEFIFNLGDWPLANGNRSHFPLFSWCKDDVSNDILLPTYKIMKGTLFGTQLENTVKVDGTCYEKGGGWASKKEVLFFRGRDSNPVRVQFSDTIAAKHPRLIDAKLSHNEYGYYPTPEAKQKDIASGMYAKKVKRRKFEYFFLNKYQLSVDGTVAAYRFPALLAGDSLVFKQESKYVEHFYREIKPYEHYIPLRNDLTDAPEKVMWAKQNDEKARQIVRNARAYARERLTPSQLLCYHFKALEEYSKLQRFTPQVRPGMELVWSPSLNASSGCRCDNLEAASAHTEL